MPLLNYAANGILTFAAQNGAATHRTRLHTSSFDVGTGVYDVQDAIAAGKLNFAGDADIYATATAWLAVMKGVYTAAWQCSFVDARHRNQDGSYAYVSTGTVAPVAGTSGGPIVDVSDLANQASINLHDLQGHLAKITLLGVDVWSAVPGITSGVGGSPYDALVAFLLSANHPIVSRHNQGLTGTARVTYTLNRRMRRKYGLS